MGSSGGDNAQAVTMQGPLVVVEVVVVMLARSTNPGRPDASGKPPEYTIYG